MSNSFILILLLKLNHLSQIDSQKSSLEKMTQYQRLKSDAELIAIYTDFNQNTERFFVKLGSAARDPKVGKIPSHKMIDFLIDPTGFFGIIQNGKVSVEQLARFQLIELNLLDVKAEDWFELSYKVQVPKTSKLYSLFEDKLILEQTGLNNIFVAEP